MTTQNTPQAEIVVRTGIARRKRVVSLILGVLALVIVAAIGVALVVLTDRTGVRFDLTAAGEQQLAPRTLALLDAADEQTSGVRIVAVGPVSNIEPRVRQEVLDVLDLIDTHRGASVTVLDTASPSGATGYQQLIDDLATDHATELDTFAAHILKGVESARARADWLTATLSPRLADMERSRPGVSRSYTQDGAAARIMARDLIKLADRADAACQDLSPLTLASANDTRSALADLLGALTKQLETLGPMVAAEPTGKPLAVVIREQRDQTAIAADLLDQVTPPPVVRVARALERGQGVLLLAPGRVSAMSFDDVFSSSTGLARTDVRRAAEGAIASGLAALLDDHRPLVVLMHAEFTPILDRFHGFDGVLDRLASRGIDVIEWPAGAANAPPPDIDAIDPSGMRPVVYVTLAPDSSVRSRNNDPATSGPARATAIGQAISDLLDRGERMLISLNPSVLPGVGGEDPLAEALKPLGIEAHTGTPLMSETFGPQGRITQIDATAFAADVERSSGHPLAEALGGLPTLLPWPVPMTTGAPKIYELEGPGRWAESEWIRIWTTPHAQRGMLLQQTTFDQEQESNQGPWTVAAAIERTHLGEPQRVLVVGSNGWFADGVALGRGEIDGRSVLLYPGNIELLESGILWLAGRDAEVAPSAQARAVPLVRALDSSVFGWLRWGLILGVPIAVLILGGVVGLVQRFRS